MQALPSLPDLPFGQNGTVQGGSRRPAIRLAASVFQRCRTSPRQCDSLIDTSQWNTPRFPGQRPFHGIEDRAWK